MTPGSLVDISKEGTVFNTSAAVGITTSPAGIGVLVTDIGAS
jgi:hypothetical protein